VRRGVSAMRLTTLQEIRAALLENCCWRVCIWQRRQVPIEGYLLSLGNSLICRAEHIRIFAICRRVSVCGSLAWRFAADLVFAFLSQAQGLGETSKIQFGTAEYTWIHQLSLSGWNVVRTVVAVDC